MRENSAEYEGECVINDSTLGRSSDWCCWSHSINGGIKSTISYHRESQFPQNNIFLGLI